MSTVLEPGTIIVPENEEDNRPVDKFGHLYESEWMNLFLQIPPTIALCGVRSADDPHVHSESNRGWEPGMTHCKLCGIPICLECLLIAGMKKDT